MYKFIVYIIVSIFCLLLFITGFLSVTALHYSTTRESKHTGFITAVEQKGFIFPNYTIYFKTDNSSSQEDQYCLFRNKKDLVQKAKEYNQKRQLVTLTYNGVRAIGVGICNGEEVTNLQLDK